MDWNEKQLDGYVKDVLDSCHLRQKFAAFGFDAVLVNGDDVEKLYEVLTRKPEDKPIAVIMDTIKGRGVKQIEETLKNHSMNVGQDVFDGWLAELQEKLDAMKAGR